jgi:hypothetical protein
MQSEGSAEVSRLASIPPSEAAARRPIVSSRVSPLKTQPPVSQTPRPSVGSGRLLKLFLVGVLAFGAAYTLVSYYRMLSKPEVITLPAAPASS